MVVRQIGEQLTRVTEGQESEPDQGRSPARPFAARFWGARPAAGLWGGLAMPVCLGRLALPPGSRGTTA